MNSSTGLPNDFEHKLVVATVCRYLRSHLQVARPSDVETLSLALELLTQSSGLDEQALSCSGMSIGSLGQ